MTPLTQLFTAVALSAVIVVALWQSSATGNTVGGFVAFITAMLMLVAPESKHLSDVMAPITRGTAAIERGMELLDTSPAEVGGSHASAQAGALPTRAQGRLQLTDVVLRYAQDQAPALDGLTLTVAAGETVALVGPSSAGKSSLINLLPRFVAPAGKSRWTVSSWPTGRSTPCAGQFALVSQDVVMFNDSIAANVALGADVDPARVRAALAGRRLCRISSTACRRSRTPSSATTAASCRGRPAPAHGHRPCAVQGRADPDPGRSHLGAGQ